jgi:hypothetical protein
MRLGHLPELARRSACNEVRDQQNARCDEARESTDHGRGDAIAWKPSHDAARDRARIPVQVRSQEEQARCSQQRNGSREQDAPGSLPVRCRQTSCPGLADDRLANTRYDRAAREHEHCGVRLGSTLSKHVGASRIQPYRYQLGQGSPTL